MISLWGVTLGEVILMFLAFLALAVLVSAAFYGASLRHTEAVILWLKDIKKDLEEIKKKLGIEEG